MMASNSGSSCHDPMKPSRSWWTCPSTPAIPASFNRACRRTSLRLTFNSAALRRRAWSAFQGTLRTVYWTSLRGPVAATGERSSFFARLRSILFMPTVYSIDVGKQGDPLSPARQLRPQAIERRGAPDRIGRGVLQPAVLRGDRLQGCAGAGLDRSEVLGGQHPPAAA